LAYRMSGHLRKELAAPRSYLSIIVVVSCIAGNWTKVAKLIGRTAVWEILGAAAGPLRAIAAAGVVLRTRFSGPTPTWAALQCGASLVRMACVMMYERLTVPQLLEGGFVPKKKPNSGNRPRHYMHGGLLCHSASSLRPVSTKAYLCASLLTASLTYRYHGGPDFKRLASHRRCSWG